jgi:hypothetical protein
MLTLRDVEYLHVVEHIPSGFFAVPVGPAPYPFTPEQVEETLCDGIVMAVSASAERCPASDVYAVERGHLARSTQLPILRCRAPPSHVPVQASAVGLRQPVHRQTRPESVTSQTASSTHRRVGTNTQPLRNLRNWITTLNVLMNSFAFEIVTEIGFAHDGLLASILGKKASTNLGAIQRTYARPSIPPPQRRKSFAGYRISFGIAR